jgi:hypothetical protein
VPFLECGAYMCAEEIAIDRDYSQRKNCFSGILVHRSMQSQPSESESNLDTVVSVALCSREAAAATLAAFGNDMIRAIEWLTSHDGQPPAVVAPAPAAVPAMFSRFEDAIRHGIPPHFGAFNPDNLPQHILDHMSHSARSSDVSALVDGSLTIPAIIAPNDAVSRTRLERVLMEASQSEPATSHVSKLCCQFIRSTSSSLSSVPIFEVNLILQFLARSFSPRRPTHDHHDDEVMVPRSSRLFGSAGSTSLGSSHDAVCDPVNGLTVSVLLELFPRLCSDHVWGTHSILEDCAAGAVGAVCYLVAVQLLTVQAGKLQASSSDVVEVSDFSWELILHTLPWLMKGRVHSAASLLLYLCSCICCSTASPNRLAPFIEAVQKMFPHDNSAERLLRLAARDRARSASPPAPSQVERPATACLVPERVSAAVVAAYSVIFQYWYSHSESNRVFHPDLENCVDPLLSLLLSIWKVAHASGGRDSGSRDSVASQGLLPLSADEREEVDYAVVRHSQRFDIAGLVQTHFQSIPYFHETYEKVQANLGAELDDIVKGFRDARLQRIDALDSCLGNLFTRSNVAPGMRSAVKRDFHGYDSIFDRTDNKSFHVSIRCDIISLLHKMLVGPSTASMDPTNPESMPDMLELFQLHPHVLSKRESVYRHGQYNCDVCHQSGNSWVYHCQPCGWDAHPECAAQHSTEVPVCGPSKSEQVSSITDLLQSCRSKFFDPKCPWLTCACEELTVAISLSTGLAEKLKQFLCELMNIVSGDGHSARYQILHSLSSATLNSHSQTVTWGLAGVLLKEISKIDIHNCFSHLLECGETDARRSATFETQLASSFSLLIINVTSSLLRFATSFDFDSKVSDSESRDSMDGLEKHQTFARVAFDLVNCIQRIFEVSSEGSNILMDRMCRDFVIDGRYHAINRHLKNDKCSLIASLAIILSHSSKLQEFHSSPATSHSSKTARWPGNCSPVISIVSEIGKTICSRSVSLFTDDLTVLRAIAIVLRLLSTNELSHIEQTLLGRKFDSFQINDIPFLKEGFDECMASHMSVTQRCEALLGACLKEMNRIISLLDTSALANDFIVSGLMQALLVLLSDSSQFESLEHEESFLPVAVRRRAFYKIFCETQKSVADPSPTFLRIIDLLKRSLEDHVDSYRPAYTPYSSSSMRMVLHDLSESEGLPQSVGEHCIHGCECVFSRHDSDYLSKLQDALKFKDKRLLPQPRGMSFAHYPFGSDRREQGFAQTLSFSEPQDWDPLPSSSAAPVRMWLCRRKCPPFNLEGRRMFVKENGVIGCGQGSCGDHSRSDYTMCQACSVTYKVQPPDFSTAFEIFSNSQFNDAVLMLPHQSPTTADPLVNRAGVVVNPGSGMVIYCGRRLGREQIPGSDGVCGPNNGPQCADCAFSFPANYERLVALPESRRSNPFGDARNSFFGAPRVSGGNIAPVNGWFSAPFPSSGSAVPVRVAPWAVSRPDPIPSVSGYVPQSPAYIPSPLRPPPVPSANPPSAPDPAIISQLVEQMGFPQNAAMRALRAG